MSSIGETLRRERQRRKLEVEDVSRELKISHKFLEAIEDERFDALPRGVFAKSFVRQYARLLGLDEEELASEVERAMEPASAMPSFGAQVAPASPPVEIRVPRMEAWEHVSDTRTGRSSSLPALAMVVVVMLVCSGVYAYWQRVHRAAPPRDETAAQAQPNRLPHNEPPPTTAAVPPVEAPQPAIPQSQPPAQQSAPQQTPPQQTPPQQTAPQQAPAVAAIPPPKPAEPPSANPNAAVRVEVTAQEMVWVLARTDGKYAFSGTLEANQTRTFDGNKVELRLGNAGGVNITLNGRPIGAVGPKGQVRTVQFTSGGFQIVAAPKPSLPLDDLL